MDESRGFREQLLRDAGITLHILLCLPGKNHWEEITAAAPSPGLGSQLSITPVLLQAQEMQSRAENKPSRLLLDHTKRPTRLCVNAVLEGSLSPPAAVGSGPLSKLLFHCSPPQPEQLRQFSAFHISGPVSIFNYSYKTAVI